MKPEPMQEAEDNNPVFEVVEAGCDQPVGMEGVVEIQETAAEVKQENESLKGEYTWTLENFSQITEPKKYSPNFEIGTHLWRLLVCPHGMNQKEMLSVYLDSPEAAFAPPNLNPTASFKLVVVNRKDPGNGDFYKESSHKWSANETDWGFTNFLPFVDLHDPEKGFLDGDALTLRVEIQVQRDERYCYDSRKETGHVGLKNQGATCYMNSLLQYLYHLPFFRKAVYHMPTSENDLPAKSLPLALQSLFYRLQYSTTPVATKDLTASFGWSTMDAFMQHDVQELNRVLCEKLEEKMKGTRVEKAINELFEGHTLNFIDCVSVDYKSQRRESFMDLQLDVKGCNHIYDSFDKYTEVEVMDGENQYKAEGYGLQDARKGVLFDSLPPVLQLQLKRFEYDFQRDTMVKINDRYEFFDELDLDRDNGKYLSPQADRSVRNLYRLHSVLVHSGGVHGGHYYAFIRPDGSTWLRFDDTAVTIEDGSKALEEQFGGEDEAAPAAGAVQGPLPEGAAAGVIAAAAGGEGAPKRLGGGGLKFTKFSNAYMLVYVRVSDWPRIMAPVTKDSIAPYLRERLEAEQREKERRQKEKQEAHLYCHVRIATDQDIADQVGRGQWFDLVDYDRLPPSRTFRVRKLTLFSDFKKQVEAALGVPAEAQRYWVWQLRQNKTYRPTARLKADEEAAMIVDLREHRELSHATAKHALMDLRLYLELPWPPSSGPQKPPSRHDILLFFKYYDPLAETLAYVGHEYVPKTLKVSDLSGLMARLAGLPPGTPLDAYEEVKWEPTVMIELLNPAALLSTTAQLESGDIICFQKALPQQQQQQQQQPSLSAAASGMSVDGGTAAAEGMEVDQQQQQQAGQQQLAQQQQQQQPSLQPSQQLQPQQQQPPHGELLQCRYPRVPEFLSYVRNRRLVTFKRLESPSEPGLQLELLREQDYDAVTAALAGQLGLDDPTKIRLTQHNAYSFQPQRAPVRYRGIHQLQAMLQHAGHVTDVLYYEVLDMPLPQLEQLKSLKIHFHNDKTEFVAEHVVRLPRDSTVGDVLRELSGRLGAEYAGRRLRLLEIYHNKIYKVADEAEEVMNVNENYWLIRAEAVPPDEEQLGPGDRIIHVHHITPPPAAPAAADAAAAAVAAPAAAAGGGEGDNNNAAGGGGGFIAAGPPSHVPTSFGDPFMLRIGADETLGQVKARIQAKLGVPAAEFASWRAAFVSIRSPPEYLADSERLAGRFAAAGAAVTEAPYLGLEHEDKGPRRPAASSSRYTFERPVKIYN